LKIDLTNKVLTSSDALHSILNDKSVDLPQAMGLRIPKREGRNLAINFLAKAKDLSTEINSSTIKRLMQVMDKLYLFEDFYSRAIDLWTSFGVTTLKIADTENDKFNKVVAHWLENVNKSMSIAHPGEDALKRLIFRQWWNLGNAFPYETWSRVTIDNETYRLPMKIMCLNPQNIDINDEKAKFGIEEIGLVVPHNMIYLDGRSNREIMPIKRQIPRSKLNKLRTNFDTGDIIVPIDKRLVVHLKRHGNHHNPWGIPFGTRAMNAFADLHRKREMDFSIVDSMIRRILMFKIGTDEIPCTDSSRIINFLNLLSNPEPTFTLVTPHDVTHEDISPNTDVLDYEKKYEHEITRILVALGIPPVMLGLKGSVNPEIEVSAFAESLLEIQRSISDYFKIILNKIIEQNPQFEGVKPHVTMSRANVNKVAHVTTMRDIYFTGNLSHRTFLENLDLDYEQEKKRREEEQGDGTDELFSPQKQPFQGDQNGIEKKTNIQIDDNRDDKKEKRKKIRKSFGIIFDYVDNMDDLVLGFNGLEQRLQDFCKFYDKYYDIKGAEQLRDFYIDSFADYKDMFKMQLFELVTGEPL
jgi:hypothetical protein